MFSYKSHRRFEKVRKSGRLYKQYSEIGRKALFVFRDFDIINCWRFERYYEKIDGVSLYQSWARGEGPIVRHLCSDGRCINPLHLIRGTDLDNAKDEIEVRDFENDLMMDMLDDYSMENESKDLVHLTLLPKVSIKICEERGAKKTLGEINKELREVFRQDYVRSLVVNIGVLSKDDVKLSIDKMKWLKNRTDILIITVPG